MGLPRNILSCIHITLWQTSMLNESFSIDWWRGRRVLLFETMITTHDSFQSSTVMLCIFHAIVWQPFKKEIYMVLPRKSSHDQPVELSDVGRTWGTSVFCIYLYFLYMDFLAHIVCFLSIHTAEFLYKIFQHQAYVYRTHDQYDRSHEILTTVLDLETTREVRYC